MSIVFLRPALVALGLLVAPLSGTPGATEAFAQDHEPMLFNCESGAVVSIQHGAGIDGNGVALRYQDRNFELHPVQSAGDRFATEQGLSPDRGLRWEMDGNTWHLSEMIMDHAASGGTVLESCVASENGSGTAGEDEAGNLPALAWRVISLPGISLVPGHEPSALVDTSGRISGNTGCNNFGGRLGRTATGITISNNFTTRMGCEEARHAVERAFLNALESAVSFKIVDGALILLANDGVDLVSLELLDTP